MIRSASGAENRAPVDCGSLEYAHARLHARHGMRLDESAWRRIEGLRDLAPMLDAARATGLRRWLLGIGAASTVHEVELGLRSHWRALVDEVAGWMPPAWQAAIAWCGVWPDLALLQHLARGGEAPQWLQDDPWWRDLAAAAPQERLAVLGAGAHAALARAWPVPQTMARVWHDEWRRRLPDSGRDANAARPRGAGPASGPTIQQSGQARVAPGGFALTPGTERDEILVQLLRVLSEHAQAFEQASPTQGWQQRAALRAKLTLLWRRATLDPAAAFIHLALAALDLERLRAELLRRIVFPHARAA
jgi:hypothetical protein